MDTRKSACRICLQIPKFGYKINETIKTMLDILLLKLESDVDDYTIICRSCALIARKSCDFKLTCIETEIKYIDCDRNQEFAERPYSVCRFCRNNINGDDFNALEVLFNKPMIQDLLPVFMPEIEYHRAKNGMLCSSCQRSLENYLELVQKYLTTEGKINKFIENEFNEGATQTLLRDLHYVNKNNYVNFILTKLLDKREKCVNFTQTVPDEKQVAHFKEVIYKNSSGTTMYKCPLCVYETKRHCWLKKHALVHNLEAKTYKCDMCPYETKQKTSMKSHTLTHDKNNLSTGESSPFDIDHPIMHNDKSSLKQYKCSQCTFETNWKSSFKKHQFRHTIMHKEKSSLKLYKCSYCPFGTNWKHNFKMHQFRHDTVDSNTVSDPKGTIYKCTNCTYETTRKDYITQHLVIHKNQSESSKTLQSLYKTTNSATSDPQGTTYKCTNCTYETTCLIDITQHLVVHDNQLERTTHKSGSNESSKTNEATTSRTTVSGPELTTYNLNTAQHLIVRGALIQESVEGETSQSSSSKRMKSSNLTVSMKKIVMRVFSCLSRDYPSFKDALVDMCSDYTGVSKATVYKILREDKMYGEVRPPRIASGRKPIEVDEDAKCAIRQIVQSFHVANDEPTVDKILRSAKENGVIPKMSKETLRKTLISMDLVFWKK